MTCTKTRLLASSAVLAALVGAAPASAQQSAPAPAAEPSKAPTELKKKDIVVTGNRQEVTTAIDRVGFSVANDLQAQAGSVADALRSIPGVDVDAQGNVSLRGDAGVKIIVDGRPSAMLNGESRGDVLLSMPAAQIERIEVINNPSAAMSPEGSGGVINLVSKKARKDMASGSLRANAGLNGSGSVNLNGSRSSNGLTLSGEVGFRRFRGKPRTTQERSVIDPATGEIFDSFQDSDTDNRFQARMARFAADYDVDKTNRLSAELNAFKFNIAGDRSDLFTTDDPQVGYDRQSDIEVSNMGTSGRLSWVKTLPGDDHELSADLQRDTGRFRRQVDAATDYADGTTQFEDIRNAFDQEDYHAKLDYKRPLGETSSLNLGYEMALETNDYEFLGDRGATPDSLVPIASLTNEFTYDELVHALFGVHQFKTGKLTVQSGVRLEQVNSTIDQLTEDVSFDNDYFRAYPTLHLNYELSEAQQLRGSFSRRIKRPTSQDLNPITIYIDPLNLRRGNPFLDPEVTDSFELGWQSRKGGTFYSLTSFFRRSTGGVTDVIEDLGDGVFLTTRENLATAKRIGTDFTASGKFSKTLSYNASGTLMWSKIDPKVDGLSDPRSGLTASVRGNLSWQPTPKDFVQLNGTYNGKQILPQGYRTFSPVLNLGYRRKVSEKLSLLLTGQDVLDTAKSKLVINTPTLRDRISQTGPGRTVTFGLAYNFGGDTGRKRSDPNFDFQQPSDGG